MKLEIAICDFEFPVHGTLCEQLDHRILEGSAKYES